MAQTEVAGVVVGGCIEIVSQSRLWSHKWCCVFTGTSVCSRNQQMLRQNDTKGEGIILFPDHENQHHKGAAASTSTKTYDRVPWPPHSPAGFVPFVPEHSLPSVFQTSSFQLVVQDHGGPPDFLGAPYVLPFSAMYLCEATLSLYISTRTTEPDRVNADVGTGTKLSSIMLGTKQICKNML